MGAGKTTVGRHLAELLGRQFLDSDHEIDVKLALRFLGSLKKKANKGFVVVKQQSLMS